ncbi:hypothetical protein [Snodgrassella communis]|uniref:Uncharacterized protein n=1 Tax=Snodgrassella alvi TaxID=1196083 RepID=A0A2N9XWS8_9NEIS|nr:hypothetical protein [Snodgrassella communis]PIT54233.1 hypothetical protein BHC48_00680 [Snodgrassella communis]
MKRSSLLLIVTITCIAACSHHENHRSASETAAITASDVQNAHLEATITLDQIANETASSSSTPISHHHSAQPASTHLQNQ